ncbi:uncharacterized protein NPIL_125271 [Nephila pilipes]|uniref:Chromo domain-containing protein n=1 Tax=Nephila pilipes TaxID=299642 RepID=A0A8X6TSU1_NEPPI|nr:uncharacterized protein NPIL_125271 [Nephila pilipes]
MVLKIYPSHPTTFELQDLKLETIKGRFYAEELQKISKRSDDYWHVEKVLKTKGRGSRKEYYVKWKGFDNRFNSRDSKKSTLSGGTHISDYQVEIDGGITEIYVYSDIIESHFVGDAIAPLLRIIPVMSTKEDQIVINYQRPLYFPLRKNYNDCIEIELKSSSGDGKTLLVLSSRRRTI